MKLKTFCLTFALAFFSFTFAAQAQSIDISLSDDSAMFQYSQMIMGENFSNLELSGGFLYDTSDNRLFALGLELVEDLEFMTTFLEVGIGGKLFFSSVNEIESLNLGLGGRFSYFIPKINQLSLGSYGYYAPNIVSFYDSDRSWIVGVQLNYNILEQAAVYVGYRVIKTDIKNSGEITVDEGVHVGLKITF